MEVALDLEDGGAEERVEPAGNVGRADFLAQLVPLRAESVAEDVREQDAHVVVPRAGRERGRGLGQFVAAPGHWGMVAVITRACNPCARARRALASPHAESRTHPAGSLFPEPQGSLLDGLDEPPPGWFVEEKRCELWATLRLVREAEQMPWGILAEIHAERRFMSISRWLPEAEGAALREQFAAEMHRLRRPAERSEESDG